ncbi:hypothetical protein [uncultured Draconibacterium sp.]|uniref:hypothetical protein n=1 Tax=uncultured Draconibacterium sp. TaxID=1573823 RepID=UPI00325FEE64
MEDSEIISCFPGHKEKIKILLSQDENFREVAADYMLCIKTLKKLKRTNNSSLVQQYSETLKELKQELIESINK